MQSSHDSMRQFFAVFSRVTWPFSMHRATKGATEAIEICTYIP